MNVYGVLSAVIIRGVGKELLFDALKIILCLLYFHKIMKEFDPQLYLNGAHNKIV